ncbi:cytochrome C [Azoarcus sp. DN11]|uniref:cytochrome C n=1 Tax=Azoarcus sp. DN11 TaxID=356837 RepID=UPI000EB38DAB|nr:cytochrome C [Azoarcus sp. DN11]
MRIEGMLGRVAALVVLCLVLGAASAWGQSLESVVMPGAVIKGHADVEHECGECHVRFSPSSQPQRCLACHRDVRADVRDGAGYHGRIKEEQCRRCHTDHKGRDAKVVVLDEKKFDHRQTDFQLRGAHRREACSGCHRTGRKYRDAPQNCYSCHRGNDKHREGLGQRCENCHVEDNWKVARFDHGRTRFPLLSRHARARCADCHVDEHYVGTARDCVSCHRKDDTHKGHNGPRCESCHTEQDWKATIFRHDRDANYALLGRHRTIECTACHRAPLYAEKLPTQCFSCHRQDDSHKGVLGAMCATCHNPEGWKSGRFDHDLNTRFALKDKHRSVKCESCHKDPGMREKPALECVGCHLRDDRERGHQGRYGGRCAACHVEQGWRTIVFDHERDTKFQRTGRHRAVKCDACHRDGPFRAKTDDRCHACHKGDDIHFGSFEQKCDTCHLPDDWRKILRAATDRFCRGGAEPGAHRRDDDPPKAAFWIPACAPVNDLPARPGRRDDGRTSDAGRRP